MNNAERQQTTYLNGAALDAAVKDKFGEATECHTYFDLFGTGTYVTHYKAESPLKEQVDAFVAGWAEGHFELSERLQDKHKHLS